MCASIHLILSINGIETTGKNSFQRAFEVNAPLKAMLCSSTAAVSNVAILLSFELLSSIKF